jgi:DHA1 family inner membrane transport protein
MSDTKERMPLAVWALAIGAFAICTTEFSILGLLLEVSQDLSVTIAQAGALVTAFAFGVVLGAPILTPFLVGLPRKKVIIFLMGLFTVGNILCAIAPTYEALMAARMFTALIHASFFGLGSVMAAQLVPKERQGQALAAVFMGATLANVLGVPAGAWIGQEFGWRATSIACAAFGLLAAAAVLAVVPAVQLDKPKNVMLEFKTLGRPEVLKALLTTLIGFGGIFTALTYIAPILTEISGFSESAVPGMMLLFGLGMTLGNPIGGKLTDKSLTLGLRVSMLTLVTVLVAIGLFAQFQPIMYVLVFVFGVAMFMTIPPLQVQAMTASADAQVMGAAFNIASFNLANALAAMFGGVIIETQGFGLASLPFVAAGVAALGLLLTYVMPVQSAGPIPTPAE